MPRIGGAEEDRTPDLLIAKDAVDLIINGLGAASRLEKAGYGVLKSTNQAQCHSWQD